MTSAAASVPTTFGPLGPTVALSLLDGNYTALVNYLNSVANRIVMAADTGAANAYVVTPLPALTALTAGQFFSFTTANANTGASTINVSALGVVTLYKLTSAGVTALVLGDVLANRPYLCATDGANVLLVNPSGATGLGPTVLGRTTVSGSPATVSFTSLPSIYDWFDLDYFGVTPTTDGSVIGVQISQAAAFNTGANYNGGTSDIKSDGTQTNAAVAANTQAPVASAVGNTANRNLNGRVRIWNPASSILKPMQIDSAWFDNAGNSWRRSGQVTFTNNANAIDGIRLMTVGGAATLSTGVVTLTGWKMQ